MRSTGPVTVGFDRLQAHRGFTAVPVLRVALPGSGGRVR
jgi:fatty-acid desaturase